jgi:hypothetical protein
MLHLQTIHPDTYNTLRRRVLEETSGPVQDEDAGFSTPFRTPAPACPDEFHDPPTPFREVLKEASLYLEKLDGLNASEISSDAAADINELALCLENILRIKHDVPELMKSIKQKMSRKSRAKRAMPKSPFEDF